MHSQCQSPAKFWRPPRRFLPERRRIPRPRSPVTLARRGRPPSRPPTRTTPGPASTASPVTALRRPRCGAHSRTFFCWRARAPPLPELRVPRAASLSDVTFPAATRASSRRAGGGPRRREHAPGARPPSGGHHPSHLPPSGTSCGEGRGRRSRAMRSATRGRLTRLRGDGRRRLGTLERGSSSTFVSRNDGWPGSAEDADRRGGERPVPQRHRGEPEMGRCWLRQRLDVRHMYASPPLPPLPRSACLALRH